MTSDAFPEPIPVCHETSRKAAAPGGSDIPAINQIVLANLGLAGRVARRCFRVFGSVVELDDLRQEAALGLLRAARYYRPDTGVRFSTYASRCCWHACVTMLRPQLDRRARTVELPDVDPPASEKSGLDLVMTREVWSLGWSRLSSAEQDVLLLRYRDGLTQREAGARRGVGAARARHIEIKALSRLAKGVGIAGKTVGGRRILIVDHSPRHCPAAPHAGR